MNYSFVSRNKILFLGILFFALILIGRLFLIQVIRGDFYSQRAAKQYYAPSSKIFSRGNIFFKTKKDELISAALQITEFRLIINTDKIINPEDVYQKLSEKIVFDHEKFLAKIEKSEGEVEITQHLSREDADIIKAKKIPGVFVYEETNRFYPGGNLASHVLGFVGFKGNELVGRYGVERHYDDKLARSKDNPYINLFAEVFSNLKNKLLWNNIEDRSDVVLTLEPIVQGFLEKKMSELMEQYQASSAGAIIMNPQDGSIYAMTVKPDFNPNNFSKVKDISVFPNPLVENVFEFGSVVKPLIMAAALEQKVVTPETEYEDKGFVKVGKKIINNFDKKGRGVVNMQEVLSKSLNTGMVFVYQQLGIEKMREYLLSYGVKDKTGIDLPNEINNLTSNLNDSKELEYANAAFGQGIAFTPISLTRALASLSNGGNLVVPHVVEKIVYNNIEKKIEYPKIPTNISKRTSEEITSMLVNVMDKSLKGGLAKIEHYSIAVKTGTAQIANEEGGGYYEDKNLHSFFGYFPAYDPKFIVFLYTIDPKDTSYASQTWTDPFLEIAKFLINYYELPPDR
jgi:cell division protein FtsI (penicillin-binding protein 3)/stage V sporulation protein D (sporulation-specific penicillin-binding protein)